MEPTHYFGYIVNGHRSCVSVCHPSILALIHLHSSIPTEIRRASTTATPSSSNDHRGRNRRTRILLHGLVQSQQIWRASDEGQELGQVLVLICKTIVVTAENSLIISPPLTVSTPPAAAHCSHLPALGIDANAATARNADLFSSSCFSYSCFTEFAFTFSVQVVFSGSTN